MMFALSAMLFFFVQNDHMLARYTLALDDEAITSELIRELEDKEVLSSVDLAYMGALTLLMSDHASNPFTKFRYFNEGKDLLDQAVEDDPDDIEIRYLRYINQVAIPAFLNYDENLREDYLAIKTGWNSDADVFLKNEMRAYFLQNERISATEKSFFEN